MKVKKIFVLTGKRGGFGAMKPMLKILRDDPNFELQLVVTDQHLNDEFGNTIQEVEQEFLCAAKVNLEQKDDSAVSRSQALGTCMIKMSRTLHTLSPDLCLLYGDRGEVLATAITATTLGIPIGHIQGGDVSGSVDEHMRHAISKLSHIHFPSTKESADRLIRMGEKESSIYVVGDHHLDALTAGEYANPQEVAQCLNINSSRPIVIVLQHPETTEPEASFNQMTTTLETIKEFDLQCVVVYPCSDVGYGGIIKSIGENAIGDNFKIFKNIDAPIFWGLLKIASVLIGNSSSGIIEAPSFHLPVVNIGRRQENRQRSENVIDVPHNKVEIKEAIQRALYDKYFIHKVQSCSQIYGDGHAGERVVDIIRTTTLDASLFVKQIAY